jgi:hypothetical protein
MTHPPALPCLHKFSDWAAGLGVNGIVLAIQTLGISLKPPSGDEVRPPTPPLQGLTYSHSSSASPHESEQRDLGVEMFPLEEAKPMLQLCATAGNLIHFTNSSVWRGCGGRSRPLLGVWGRPPAGDAQSLNLSRSPPKLN